MTVTIRKDSRVRLGGMAWHKGMTLEGEDYGRESVILI